ncbi:MAG: helix-turn-helix transcriptional regulator [Myxococcota bacterium]
MIEAWRRRLGLLRILLQRGNIATSEAARAMGVDRRKAREDLQALEEHGVPLTPVGEKHARRWKMGDAWRYLGMNVGLEERLALLFGRELVGSFLHDTDFGEALDRLDRHFEAIGGGPDPRRDELSRRFYYVREPDKDYRIHRETLKVLVEAILASHRVDFTYRAAHDGGEPREVRAAAPLTLAIYKRGLYLLADKRDEVKAYAVERVAEAVGRPEQTFDYPRPSEYAPAELLSKRFGISSNREPAQTVRLRFERAVRPYVEGRRWMPDQRLEPLGDGRLDLVFEGTGHELVSLALGFGDTVEVIEPRWLRDRVRRELAGALAKYEESEA